MFFREAQKNIFISFWVGVVVVGGVEKVENFEKVNKNKAFELFFIHFFSSFSVLIG